MKGPPAAADASRTAAIHNRFTLAQTGRAKYEPTHANFLLAVGRRSPGYNRIPWLSPGADFEKGRADGVRRDSGWLRGETHHPAKLQRHERADHFLWRHHQGASGPGSEWEFHKRSPLD